MLMSGAALEDGPAAFGTLSLESRAPLFDSRISFAGGRLAPLPAGVGELVLAASHVNLWAQMPGYFLDGEVTRAFVRGSFGIGEGTDLSLQLTGMRRSGGFMDRSIEAFHSLFRVTQARRERYPRDQLRLVT